MKQNEDNDFVCNCEWCVNTRKLGLEFDHFEPKTKLQKRMKDVIAKIEKRYLREKNNSKNEQFHCDT